MRCRCAGSQTNILDFIVWVATFLGVTFAGVEIGIAIGVGLSFLYVALKVRCRIGHGLTFPTLLPPANHCPFLIPRMLP